MIEDVFALLKDNYAFIYGMGDDYYYIGRGVFRKCVPEEIGWYGEYWEEMTRVNNCNSALTAKDTEKLRTVFEKIIAVGKQLYNVAEENSARTLLEKKLQLCTKEDLKEIRDQHMCFIKAMEINDEFQQHVKI